MRIWSIPSASDADYFVYGGSTGLPATVLAAIGKRRLCQVFHNAL